uniref:Reticulophagy regulator 1 n=1 Tax=Steinernema glaseri TaxID=37863 RepID=A0A1I7ZIR0_9BILA
MARTRSLSSSSDEWSVISEDSVELHGDHNECEISSEGLIHLKDILGKNNTEEDVDLVAKDSQTLGKLSDSAVAATEASEGGIAKVVEDMDSLSDSLNDLDKISEQADQAEVAGQCEKDSVSTEVDDSIDLIGLLLMCPLLALLPYVYMQLAELLYLNL